MDHGTRREDDTVSTVLQPPAEIRFLVIEEEILLEQTRGVERTPLEQKTHAASPEQLCLLVVLTPILLGVEDDPATAVRHAELVQHASRGPGVLEMPRVAHGPDLGLYG